jgi:hypothetical protein
MQKTNMPYSTFRLRFLEPFERAVNNHKYQKIDYQTWRIWTRFANLVTIEIGFKNSAVIIEAKEMSWEFPFWDNSFGSFMKSLLDDEINNNLDNKNEKENDEMKNIVNFDFGPCTGSDNIRMSVYGIAVKNANGTFVSYDAANAAIMDVDVFNFDGAKFLYKMPVAIKDIKVGDVVIHARKPMFVTDIAVNDKSLKVVDPVSGEKKEIILTRSPFGFDFATKIVNFLGNIGGNSAANADNPFGNLWMFMLMNDNGDTDNILPFMLMSQNGGNIDPMMMFALMGNKGDTSWLPFLMMSNANKPHTCSCGGNCGSTESN